MTRVSERVMSDSDESTSVQIRVRHTPYPPTSRAGMVVFVRPSILVSTSTQTSTPYPTPVSLSKHHRATKIIFDTQSKYITAQYESLENEVEKFEQNKKELEDQLSKYKLQKISLDKKQFEQQIVDSQQIETRNRLERSINEFRQDKEETIFLLQRERGKLNEHHNHYKEIQLKTLSFSNKCEVHTKKLQELERLHDSDTLQIAELERDVKKMNKQHSQNVFTREKLRKENNEWEKHMGNFIDYLHQQVFDWRGVVKEINTIFTSDYSLI